MLEARERQVMALYTKLQGVFQLDFLTYALKAGCAAGYSRAEARLSYLDYVRSLKHYGSAYFYAEPQNSRDLPREVCVIGRCHVR
jgi:hypothetical protein